MTVTQLFDSIAIRVNGPKAWSETLSIRWYLSNSQEHFRMELSNGALIHYPTGDKQAADVAITLTKPQLLRLLLANASDGVQIEGDAKVLAKVIGLLDSPDPDFAIVTP